MEKEIYSAYTAILRHELVPAMGCTEPIAIALAAAKARALLGKDVFSMTAECSGDIIKNAQCVIVPNSGGEKGIAIAAILGAIAGNPDAGLEVLSAVKAESAERAKKLRDQGLCLCSHAKGKGNLYIRIECRAEDSSCAAVTVSGTHTNIVREEKDGAVLLDRESEGAADDPTEKLKELLSVKDIIEYARTVNLEDVEDVISRQISCNKAISMEGLSGNWGARVGHTLMSFYGSDDVRVRARAAAAAGSDARMSGCALPVVINSGSGNQGMAVSLPVIEYAESMGAPREKLVRALVLANLAALLQKRYIGSLSAYCGAVSAGAGAGCGIAFLHDASNEVIEATLSNTLADVGGIVCDGAKPSCAAKVASAVDAAILAFEMKYHAGTAFHAGDGLVKDDIENTIASFGRVGRDGMKSTDEEILSIILETKKRNHQQE